MKYGAVLPFGDARDVARYASVAEAAGWDAVFVAEGVWAADAWICLATAALATQRIRLGTLLTPVARIRPWDLASRVGTVDRLSGGRVILGAGLGALHDGWLAFEADQGRRTRVELLEECLAIYAGLMRGQPFEFHGHHYQARPPDFAVPDPPVQQPRPPVWLVGALVDGQPEQPSLARAARWDGLLPEVIRQGERAKVRTPEELAGIVGLTAGLRAAGGLPVTASGALPPGYDVILEADSYSGFLQMTCTDAAAWAAAGATWWIESWWDLAGVARGEQILLDRLAAGPPS